MRSRCLFLLSRLKLDDLIDKIKHYFVVQILLTYSFHLPQQLVSSIIRLSSFTTDHLMECVDLNSDQARLHMLHPLHLRSACCSRKKSPRVQGQCKITVVVIVQRCIHSLQLHHRRNRHCVGGAVSNCSRFVRTAADQHAYWDRRLNTSLQLVLLNRSVVSPFFARHGLVEECWNIPSHTQGASALY